MLCNVCRQGLEGIWDPEKAKRLGHLKDFPEIVNLQFDDFENLDGLPLEEIETYVFGHHKTYESCALSKEQGCVSCSMFEYEHDDEVNATLARLGYYSVFCVSLRPRPYQPNPMMLVYSGEEMTEFPHALVPNDENDPINTALAPSTGSPETWALVQKWLDNCLGTHEDCRRDTLPDSPENNSSMYSPTRLLELQTPPPLPLPRHLRPQKRPQIGSSSFRLVDRTQYPANVKYVALSHCWGPGPAHTKLRLIKESEGKLRRGLPVSILPRTFREAFEIVARLGMRYLWIDRLCIVQDSAADWAAEAGTMLGVYRGAFLSIAALGSPDDEGGCFFERDVKMVAPMAISLSPPSPGGVVGKRRRRDSKLDFDDDPFAGTSYRLEEEKQAWKVTFSREPLLSRAWVLQERMLSRRTLYFGRQQVFWECLGASCCETMPTGGLSEGEDPYTPSLPPSNRSSSIKTKGDSTRSAPATLPEHVSSWKLLITTHDGWLPDLDNRWNAAIQTYSRCNLTFADDKLVALSGLARQFASLFVETPLVSGKNIGGRIVYAAGLWLHTMPQSLLWMTKAPARRPASYRAPSWSWTAVDGEIEVYRGRGASWPVEVMRVVTVPRGTDPMGALSSGMIELKGALFVLGKLKYRKPGAGELHRHFSTVIKHPDTGARLDIELNGAWVQFDALEDYQDEVIALMICFTRSGGFPKVETCGLALAVVDRTKSLYRRVGCAGSWMHVDVSDTDYKNTFVNQFPRHTIQIV